MKKQIKKLFIIIVIAMFVVINSTKVYADPNSSKGFAEYDDTTATEQNQEMLEEQQKQQEESIGKSTNNYLENLQVEGYELTPRFDKQTIEYTINGEVNTNEINIIATASDEKATIQGAGKINLEENQNEIRIDVIAESGTVRTYMIHINEPTTPDENEDQTEAEGTIEPEEMSEEENEETTETSTILGTENQSAGNNTTNEEQSNMTIWIVVAIIAIIIIAVLVINKKNKGKHM